jgi:hypothetical protein
LIQDLIEISFDRFDGHRLLSGRAACFGISIFLGMNHEVSKAQGNIDMWHLPTGLRNREKALGAASVQ